MRARSSSWSRSMRSPRRPAMRRSMASRSASARTSTSRAGGDVLHPLLARQQAEIAVDRVPREIAAERGETERRQRVAHPPLHLATEGHERPGSPRRAHPARRPHRIRSRAIWQGFCAKRTSSARAAAAQRRRIGAAGVARRGPQLLLDADELVVLGQAVGAAERAGLDLPAVGGDREVGDGGVLRLAGAVAHHRLVAGAVRGLAPPPGSRTACRSGSPSPGWRCRRRCSMPWRRRSGLVTKRSSPTSWTVAPSLSVSSFQPSQSSSEQPSSMETIGHLAQSAAR